jgi:hypothetical protein
LVKPEAFLLCQYWLFTGNATLHRQKQVRIWPGQSVLQRCFRWQLLPQFSAKLLDSALSSAVKGSSRENNPCFTLFRLEGTLSRCVLGPVLHWALRRLASIFFLELIFSSSVSANEKQ